MWIRCDASPRTCRNYNERYEIHNELNYCCVLRRNHSIRTWNTIKISPSANAQACDLQTTWGNNLRTSATAECGVVLCNISVYIVGKDRRIYNQRLLSSSVHDLAKYIHNTVRRIFKDTLHAIIETRIQISIWSSDLTDSNVISIWQLVLYLECRRSLCMQNF